MFYVGIQGSYKSFEITIFKDTEAIQTIVGDGIQASSQFLPLFEQILKNNSLHFNDLTFLAVDQGPGAFTSLRVIIATVNGLAFSSHVKLVGVDGLDALAYETSFAETVKPAVLITLLNAYNHEVYYGIYTMGDSLSLVMPKGYKKIDVLLHELEALPGPFFFTGNGAVLHKDLIFERFRDRIRMPYAQFTVCSSTQVGLMGLEQWKKQIGVCSELTPLYLKAQTFAVRKSIQ
jgi:universal bacterial protein YeaZ